jgi:16S rRNA (cytosine1402-N4)-methyltransferase
MTSALRAEPQLVLPGVVESVEWTWAEEETDNMLFVHATVMKAEVLAALAPHAGVYVDATVGGGGHAEAILCASPDTRVIAIDRDPTALEATRTRLAPFGERATFVHARFGLVEERLEALGIREVDGLCADLGVSSPQLDDPTRGISFRHEGPLDMRMDPTSGETALEMIERLTEEELADVIFHAGDERRSRRIARSIKRSLRDKELSSTLELRRAIVRAVGPVRVGGVDPATRTFQALRITLNDELGELDRLLASLPRILRKGGIAAILSFHSLEDRRVKHTFADKSVWQPLTKKPQMATDAECELNPRASSAKLRAAKLTIGVTAPEQATKKAGA